MYEDWLGVNFLPLTSNKVGEFYTGTNFKNKQDFSNLKYVYCVGVDSFSNLFPKIGKTNTKIIAQTPFWESLIKKATIVLPSTLFIEKKGTYINLEGLVQKTSKVFSGPDVTRNDDIILRSMFDSYLEDLTNRSFYSEEFEGEKQEANFIDILAAKKSGESFTKSFLLSPPVNLGKIKKTPFKASISNFFSNNILTKKSQTLSKCASNFKKNYINFIKN